MSVERIEKEWLTFRDRPRQEQWEGVNKKFLTTIAAHGNTLRPSLKQLFLANGDEQFVRRSAKVAITVENQPKTVSLVLIGGQLRAEISEDQREFMLKGDVVKLSGFDMDTLKTDALDYWSTIARNAISTLYNRPIRIRSR